MSVLRESPPDAHRVLIAGHNPGLEGLLEHLCEQRVPYTSDGKLLPTAALAHLQIGTAWGELDKGCATLLSITRSRSLSDY
jgi:phosphohistidine phosphatase